MTYFFPFWIVKLKNDINFEKFEKPNLILMPLFKKNLRFWFFCFPLDYMPYKIAFIYNNKTQNIQARPAFGTFGEDEFFQGPQREELNAKQIAEGDKGVGVFP